MQAFRHASSSLPNSREAARACLDELGPVPAEARLGFVFATD